MFQTYLIQPIYNGFIYLIGVMPQGDVGLAIIAMTIIVRAVFYPAFAASIRMQMGMQAVQGKIEEINTKYKDNTEERARKTMALYKEHNIRPFAGFLAILVQIPVFIALYYAFFNEGLPKVAAEKLYSFVPIPSQVNTEFFGILNLLTPYNIFLTIIVGLLQYAVARLSMGRMTISPTLPPEKAKAQKLQQQMMLYFMPALIASISYTLPAAVGLYFAAGNIISLGQEWLIRKQRS